MTDPDVDVTKLREFVAVLEFGELFPPAKISDALPDLGPLWAAARRSHDAEHG